MKVFAILPSLVAAYQVLDSSNHVDLDAGRNYDGMKSVLKGISEQQKKGEIDAATIARVQEIIDSIESDLKKALDQDVITTQKLLDDAEQAIANCDNAKNNWAADTLPTLAKNVADDKKAHADCRNNVEAAECANATAKCDTYTSQVCAFTECVKPTGRFAVSDNDDVFDYMCCLEGLFSAERATYYDNRKNCEDAVNIWTAQATTCDGKQNEFEAEFCATEHAVENECETYRTCRNSKQAAYTTEKQNVQELEQIFRAQRVALECLVCYGDHILANATDLSDCEILPECTSLTDCPTITYDVIPACIPCSEPDHDVPCSSNFLSGQYSQFENTCTPVQACKACTTRISGFAQTEKAAECAAVAATTFD